MVFFFRTVWWRIKSRNIFGRKRILSEKYFVVTVFCWNRIWSDPQLVGKYLIGIFFFGKIFYWNSISSVFFGIEFCRNHILLEFIFSENILSKTYFIGTEFCRNRILSGTYFVGTAFFWKNNKIEIILLEHRNIIFQINVYFASLFF